VLASAHDMAREHRLISAVGTTDVPVPPAFGLCIDESVNGAPFYVMGYVEGVVLDAPDKAEVMDRETRRVAGFHLVDVLADLHAVDVEAVGRRYVETIEPTANATISSLTARGWTCMILSGGFRPAIRPLADVLGVARIEAVDLFFNEDGSYRDFDRAYPTTRSGGKPEMVAALRRELNPERVVMVGDGASDLETKPVVDLFVGFGRYVAREKVRLGAHHFITSLEELTSLL